jgi:hypothetical protein
MALDTVVETRVIEGVIRPGGGVMALRADLSIVVGWSLFGMALGAVIETCVIKIVIRPGCGFMAVFAFGPIVVGWGFTGMTFGAVVVEFSMVEAVIAPIFGIVTATTILTIMVGG